MNPRAWLVLIVAWVGMPAVSLNAQGDVAAPTNKHNLSVTGPGPVKAQTETEICIFTGLGGICSRLCPPACPGTFGCFGVLGGGIDPGAVVDVCVPITTQLCTPCMAACGERSTTCSTGTHARGRFFP